MKPGTVVRAQLSDGEWYTCGLLREARDQGCVILLAPNGAEVVAHHDELHQSGWYPGAPLRPGDVVQLVDGEFPGEYTVREVTDLLLIVLDIPNPRSSTGAFPPAALLVRQRADVADLYRDLGLPVPVATRQEALL